MSKKKENVPAASLKRRKHGLGLPIHIKKGIYIIKNEVLYNMSIQYPIIYQLYQIS